MQTLFKEIIPKRYVNGNEMKENSSNVLVSISLSLVWL